MAGKAAKIVLTEKQLGTVEEIARSRTASLRLIQRCRIILLAFAGALNTTIAEEVELHRDRVGLWRRRWQQSTAARVAVECHETTAELRRAIEDVLSDAPPAGSPGTFSGEQLTRILAVACEPPELHGRSHHRRHCKTPRNLEGKMGKGEANWRKFGSGAVTIVIFGTRITTKIRIRITITEERVSREGVNGYSRCLGTLEMCRTCLSTGC